MPTVQELSAQIVGEVPSLPFLFAKNYINQSLDEISRDYLWSWDINEGMLIIPQVVTTGTVDVTNFSNEVQFDATAQAALLPLVLANPPLTSRQFRVMGGAIYNLVGYDTGTGIGTLDRIYLANTTTGSQFQIYRCYYGPPSTDGVNPNLDFLRYLTILDPVNGYSISGKSLYMTRETLNRRDPMRGAQGQAYYAASYRPAPNQMNTSGNPPRGVNDGQMQYELWPHPLYAQQLLCQYQRKHLELGFQDYLPTSMPPNLVRYKVQEFAFRWAQQNMGRIPELKGVNWPLLLNEVQRKYQFELVEAKRNDQEMVVNILRPGKVGLSDFFGPVDSNWAQSHGVASWT